MKAPPQEPRSASGARGLALSALVALAVVVAADQGFRRTSLREGLEGESLYRAKARELEEGARPIDLLVTGDSRILHGVDPRALESELDAAGIPGLRAYNAGLSGAPPIAQLALIRRALGRAVPPRAVAIGLSPYMFSSAIHRGTAREAIATLYRISDLPAAARAGASAEELATALFSELFAAERVRPRLLEVLLQGRPVKPRVETGTAGFVGYAPVSAATQAERGRTRGLAYRKELWPPATLGNENQGYLREALRALAEARVPVLLVGTPAASQMELSYGPTSLREAHLAYLRAIAAEHGVAFVDLERAPGVTDDDFVDGDHLDRDGAAKLARVLARDHLAPLLRAR